MPILQIDSENFKEALKKLGIPAIIAAAIVAYFFSIQPAKYMTYEEWNATIAAYDAKVQMIKADCKNDTRCVSTNEGNRVLFRPSIQEVLLLKSIDDVFVDRMNTWISDDYKDANTYKITPVKEIER